jgi:hypothetical protein
MNSERGVSMSNKYIEKLRFEWGTQKYIITAKKKGILIYQDVRRNHVEGMVEMIDGEERKMIEHKYLVFDIPEDVDYDHFLEIEPERLLGIEVRWFPGWTEVACHSPQAYECGLLEKLEELGYIAYVVKEIPYEKNEYPYYMNAKGWRVIYNLINGLRGTVKRGRFSSATKIEEDEIEQP